jgi:hypothetical protein
MQHSENASENRADGQGGCLGPTSGGGTLEGIEVKVDGGQRFAKLPMLGMRLVND